MGDPGDGTTAALIEEYKQINENLRFYGNMRFAQLTLLNATTAALFLAAFKSPEVLPVVRPLVKVAGVLASLCFLVMELRAVRYWRQFRFRALRVEELLGLHQHRSVTTGGFGATHAVLALMFSILVFWVVALLLPLGAKGSETVRDTPRPVAGGGPALELLWSSPPAALPIFWIALVVTVTALGALLAAAVYAKRAAQAVAADQRPLVVLEREGQDGWLANIGRGPALAVQLVDSDGYVQQALGALPTGARVPLSFLAGSRLDNSGGLHCSIFYQELSAHWHETRVAAEGGRFKCRFTGRTCAVPPEVFAASVVEAVAGESASAPGRRGWK